MSKIVSSLLACLVMAGAAAMTPAVASARAAHHGATTRSEPDDGGHAGFMWSPERAPDGPVKIVISLPAQRAYVYRDGVEIGVSPVSTGMEGRETPTGTFTILEKQRFHRSNKYDNAPMPYMQRITWAGVAMHGGHLPGYPASHGCIRFPQAFARDLYGVTSVGTQVVITDDDGAEPDQWAAGHERRPSAGAQAADETDGWALPDDNDAP